MFEIVLPLAVPHLDWRSEVDSVDRKYIYGNHVNTHGSIH